MVSSVNRIVLFRFHKHLDVCKNRLQLLKKFNPGIKIYGLGEESNYREAQKTLGNYLEHIYYVPNKTKEWNWKNSDLAVRQWFIDYGANLPFDVLHLIEWDLLLFDSLSKIYKIPKNGIGLTALTPLEKVAHIWDWIYEEPSKSEWSELLRYVKKKYGKLPKLYASLGPGSYLPRRFLEKYANIDIPELCHDELRLPLFGQILGFKLYNTGFLQDWLDSKEYKFFNCDNIDIRKAAILKELSKSSGRRVFHPYRKIWRPE